MSDVRLQVVLARAGIGSRRACEKLITQGAVTVNGHVITKLGTQVDPAADVVTIGGRTISRPERLRHVLLHKPRGVVSTVHDPEGRTTVLALLAGVNERVYPVGRLDLQSEGLILLTNDGALTDALLHPRSSVPRLYVAKVRRRLTDVAIEQLRRGVFVGGSRTLPIETRHVKGGDNATWIQVVVHEGRQHLVRDALAAVGHAVVRLRRTAFGPIELGPLPPGAFRDLTPREVLLLRQAAGLEKGIAPVKARLTIDRWKRPDVVPAVTPTRPSSARAPSGTRAGAPPPRGGRPSARPRPAGDGRQGAKSRPGGKPRPAGDSRQSAKSRPGGTARPAGKQRPAGNARSGAPSRPGGGRPGAKSRPAERQQASKPRASRPSGKNASRGPAGKGTRPPAAQSKPGSKPPPRGGGGRQSHGKRSR